MKKIKLYKVTGTGKAIECKSLFAPSTKFRIELDSDGESDFIKYYQGDKLKFVKVIEYYSDYESEV